MKTPAPANPLVTQFPILKPVVDLIAAHDAAIAERADLEARLPKADSAIEAALKRANPDDAQALALIGGMRLQREVIARKIPQLDERITKLSGPDMAAVLSAPRSAFIDKIGQLEHSVPNADVPEHLPRDRPRP
jgi:hypothetical protein